MATLALCSALACAESPDPKPTTGHLPAGGDGDGDGDSSNPGNGDGADGDGGHALDPQDNEPDACADIETTPVRTVPSVVFLVDGSLSMVCEYPGSETCDGRQGTPVGAKSRWQVLSEALVGSPGQPGLVESLGSVIRFGLWIYNDDANTNVCPGFPSKIDPALNQSQLITQSFPATPPGFNTPTGVALAALVAALPDPVQRDQMKLGPQRIVLATDGEPFACQNRETLEKPPVDYQSVLDATAQAGAKDISVYAMSLAPATGMQANHLQQVAASGNTKQAYTPANTDQLRAALNDIIEDAISCTLEIEGEISDPSSCKGQGKLGDSVLFCGQPNGFSILDAHHVRLEGTACETFKREPGIQLSMKFPCWQLQ
ncbi:MAG: hypothetical protein QM778_38235 [Myxococcales bacterium]